jgi:hypothetical protein
MRAEVVSRCGLSSSLKERHLFLFLNPTTLLNSSCRGLNSFAVSLSLSLSPLSLNQSFVPHFLKRPRNRLKKSGDKICSNAQRSTRQIRGHGALSADAEHPLERAIEDRTLDRHDWASGELYLAPRPEARSPQGKDKQGLR